ncbi:hypothetical protein MT340_000220 [Staphylococcus sp. NRL 16/872]|uniref:hypothetical protein n=1 Tax=Staphylococcus sp. NRL 16/872 TaxID=2930131 RepID=UPI001FB27704|nr:MULTISPECIES: hypothetical protein [unclassified Staphylococcus]MCJ1661042.1 hypothetical protein [Staphylococcus sp. NRL 18/288]MCJ1666940.1 hypothetical protein [Staphylococcus sp. NRL 19/737]WEN69412.1 hypothetical protein MT340_000220 [Staphylococcus sp. NRL 16/872]
MFIFGDYAVETPPVDPISDLMMFTLSMAGLFGKDLIIFTIIAILYFVMIKGLSSLIYRKSEKLDTYDKIATKLDGPLKYLLSFVFFILVTLGVMQVLSYYLIATGFFWIIIFTVGFALIFILFPYFMIFLPFFKRNKYWGFLKTIPWIVIMAGTTVYGIEIMLDTNNKIYTDEGGVGYTEGSLLFKELGGASYLLASLLGVAVIIIKIVATKRAQKEEATSNQSEEQ